MSEERTEGCKLRSGFEGLEAFVACQAITDAEFFQSTDRGATSRKSQPNLMDGAAKSRCSIGT
jgi:hypothetical protein